MTAPVEIERKFLVTGDGWRQGATVELLAQGYLPTTDICAVRVRIAGARGYLTIKGPAEAGVRAEFEYPIPLDHAEAMLGRFCGGRTIRKRRYSCRYAGRLWTVDEFEGVLAGLLLAEIEFERVGEQIDLPPWVGREVTDDPRYFNNVLVKAAAPPTD